MPRKKKDIFEKINDLIRETDIYEIGATEYGSDEKPSFLMLKKKEMTITVTNEKSVFQPYEKTEKKEIIVAFLLSYSTKTVPASFKKYLQLGCPLLRMKEQDNLEHLCEGI